MATLRGALSDRSLVPLLARAVRAMEGVVDVPEWISVMPREAFDDGQST
ncbi:hypothetical protein [Streptomyces sp. NPDC001927]